MSTMCAKWRQENKITNIWIKLRTRLRVTKRRIIKSQELKNHIKTEQS